MIIPLLIRICWFPLIHYRENGNLVGDTPTRKTKLPFNLKSVGNKKSLIIDRTDLMQIVISNIKEHWNFLNFRETRSFLPGMSVINTDHSAWLGEIGLRNNRNWRETRAKVRR